MRIAVAELWRYPVKSLRGESLERAEVLSDGFAGDRLLRVDGPRGHLTARTVPALLGLSASIGEAGEPRIDGIDWRSTYAEAAIRAAAGDSATLTPTSDGGKRFDDSPILICSDGALAELGVDRRRFRPNLVLSGVEGRGEREWLGRSLRIGSALLEVAVPCERCLVTTIDPDTLEIDPDILRRINAELDSRMGMYCRVAEPGEIAVWDAVTLV